MGIGASKNLQCVLVYAIVTCIDIAIQLKLYWSFNYLIESENSVDF